MESWEEIVGRISREQTNHNGDNNSPKHFTFLLYLGPRTQSALESKLANFTIQEEESDHFGTKYHLFDAEKDLHLRYQPGRDPSAIAAFQEHSGGISNATASLSLHPSATLASVQGTEELMYESISEMGNYLVTLGVPFETVSPPSRYIPPE